MSVPQSQGLVAYEQLNVDPVTVRAGDLVHVRGAHRSVRDMRSSPSGGKLLLFDGGVTYRLAFGAQLNARRPWRAQPGPPGRAAR